MIIGDVIRTVGPVSLPVSVVELKDHCNLEGVEGKEALLASYIAAATEMVEQWTGLALITQTLEQRFSTFGTAGLVLRRRPLQQSGSPIAPSVGIVYLDGDGAPVDLSGAVYTVSGIGWDKRPATVSLGYGQSWPAVYGHPEAVRVTYTAGYGDTASSVPQLIRHAIMLAAATMFGFREDLGMTSARQGGFGISELPWGSRMLLSEWRPLPLA